MRVPSVVIILVAAACAEPAPEVARGGRAQDCALLRVIDGDTVDLACGGAVQRTRLLGLDTPEKYSPACRSEHQRALAAERHLASLLRGAAITAEIRGYDRYGRTLALLRADGRDLAGQMIDAGHARAYSGGPRQGWCA